MMQHRHASLHQDLDVTAIGPSCPARLAFRRDGAAQGPHRAFEIQLAGNGLGDHAVEVAALIMAG